jgi:hypothetical protein
MAAEGVVVTQANEATPNIGDLFAGKGFLITQRVPMRTNFLDRVRANGGRIVRLETQADYIIADHVRNDCPPTSLSYTFIEEAIRAGALPDPNDHRAGPAPGIARAVGSTVIPPKTTRTPFTPQDDRDLWMWVQNYQSLGVHGIKGHEIYKQLEAINPRHTFQSWRDRYVKKLMVNPPQDVPPPPNVGAPPMLPASSQVRKPAVDGTAEEEVQEEEEIEAEVSADVKFLLENIDDILNIPAEDLDLVWASLADEELSSHLTAEQWKRVYEEEALPAYEARQKKAKRAQASPKKRKALVSTPEPLPQDGQPTTPELVAMRAKAAKAAKDKEASPSVSQKRRRQTATPQGNKYGRKRARTDHSDIFAEEQLAGNGIEPPSADLPQPVEPSTKPQDVTESALENENVDGGNVDESALPIEEPLPTSELNRGAKAQLIAEANSKEIEPGLPPQPQVQDEIENTTTEDAQDEVEVVPQNGLQLTEENLAHQQAEHGVKLTRASDLPENNGDIGNYAEYLQELMAGKTAEGTGQLPKEGDRNVAEHDMELESDRELSSEVPNTSNMPQNGADVVSAVSKKNLPAQQVAPNGDFDPFSVPNSPEALKAPAPEASGNGALPGAADDDIFGESPARVGLRESDLLGDDSVFPNQIATQGDGFNFPPADGGLGVVDDEPVESQALAGSGQQGSDEEMTDNVEIDLTLAEPEGGFDFSSHEEAQSNGISGQHQWEPEQPLAADQIQLNGGFATIPNGALAIPDVPIMSEDDEMEEAPAKAIDPLLHAALDTQDIYASGAQQPDFSFPLPPDSDVEEPEPELPADPVEKPTPAQQPTPEPTKSSRKRPKSTTPRKLVQPSTHQQPVAAPDREPEAESVESFLARLTASGYAPASVSTAIYRTSAQLQAAELVAMYEKIGLPVPDIPEFWSEEDDAKVGTTDAKVFKELCERKGWEEYDLRLRFLQDWRAGL